MDYKENKALTLNKLFKLFFSIKGVAIDFFKAHLDTAAQTGLDWDSIKPIPCDLVAPEQRALYIDIAYECQIFQEVAYLYIILDKGPLNDPLRSKRFLEYSMRLMRYHFEHTLIEDGDPLPDPETLSLTIMPICLYIGQDKDKDEEEQSHLSNISEVSKISEQYETEKNTERKLMLKIARLMHQNKAPSTRLH